MTGGEFFLLALGPTLALAAGLVIYGIGTYGPEARRSLRGSAGDGVDRAHGAGRP